MFIYCSQWECQKDKGSLYGVKISTDRGKTCLPSELIVYENYSGKCYVCLHSKFRLPSSPNNKKSAGWHCAEGKILVFGAESFGENLAWKTYMYIL